MKLEGKSGKIIAIGCCFSPKFINSGTLDENISGMLCGRYDGIYKIVKYWPEKGQSGFLVWRYLLRRDDPDPAPWTAAGRRRILELGIQDMVVSDGGGRCRWVLRGGGRWQTAGE